MAEFHGTFTNAYCGLDDVVRESRIRLLADSRPSLGDAADVAELSANDLTMWLKQAGQTAITPATVTAGSIEALALRKINALLAAADLIRALPERERSTQNASVGALTEEAEKRKTDLLSYLDESGGVSLLWNHTRSGDTAVQTDDDQGEEEDLTTYVTHRTRF